MKIRKKLNEKLIKELSELRNSRNEIQNFTNNFLINLGYRHYFISRLLEDYKNKKLEDKTVLEVASSYYLSSLVTCWETYFRDIFVFICDIDTKIGEKIKSILDEKQISLEEIKKQNISIGEFMSKQYNFQDLNQITNALNFLFDEEFDNISEYVYTEIKKEHLFRNINFLIYWCKDKENFKKNVSETLNKIFEIRHRVTHDANYRFKINSELMTKADDCIIMIPQYISGIICEKYNLDRKMARIEDDNMLTLTNHKIQGYLPYIVTIKDLDAKYYIED
jgi:hypothetical protein